MRNMSTVKEKWCPKFLEYKMVYLLFTTCLSWYEFYTIGSDGPVLVSESSVIIEIDSLRISS